MPHRGQGLDTSGRLLPRDGRMRSLLVAACAALAFGALHQAFVTRAHPDALYMDSLRLLYQLQEWQQGRLSFVELWGLGSAHRGFINALALMANVRLFSLDVMLANRMTGVVVATVAFLLAYRLDREPFWQRGRWHPRRGLWRAAAALAIAGLCFSWAGFELFTLDLGLPLWTKNLCFVLFFLAHDRLLRAQGSAGAGQAWTALALAVAGVVIVMFVGMGWSYAYAGAVAGVQLLAAFHDLRGGRRTGLLLRCVPLLALLAALGWSLAQGGGGQGEDGHSFAKLFGTLPRMAELSLYALGAAWIGVETLAQRGVPLGLVPWLGAAGLVAAACGIASRLRRGLYSGSLVPLYLVGYGVLTALSLAAARGDGGPMAVMASRYYMDVVLFLVGALWLWLEALASGGRTSPAQPAAWAFLAFWLAVGAGLALTYDREWKATPYRADAFRAMNQALRAGVPDEAAARLLQSPLEHARLGAGILRERGLALFAAEGPGGGCEVRRAGGWHAAEPTGAWMDGAAVLAVPACGCALVADAYLPEGFAARRLRIEDGADVREIAMQPGQPARVAFPVLGGARQVRLSVSRTTVPAAEIPGSGDQRRLGLFWTGMRFECVPAGEAR